MIAALSLLMIAAGTGCDGTQKNSTLTAMFSGGGNRVSEKTEHIFEVSGPIAVDVESLGGDVVIRTNTRATDWATVTVVGETRHGNFRSDHAEAALADIQHSASMEPGEFGPVLTVRTWTDNPEVHYLRGHVEIVLPAVEGVYVRTKRGRVKLMGCEGKMDVQTTGGDVWVISDRPMLDPISVYTSNGDIQYRARIGSTGAFLCQTEAGTIKSKQRFGRWRLHSQDSHTLIATLNDGTNPVELRTDRGNIGIAISDNPTAVGLLIIDP